MTVSRVQRLEFSARDLVLHLGMVCLEHFAATLAVVDQAAGLQMTG